MHARIVHMQLNPYRCDEAVDIAYIPPIKRLQPPRHNFGVFTLQPL